MASASADLMVTNVTTERDNLRNAAKSAFQRIDSGQGSSAYISEMLQRSALLTQVLAEITALGL